MRRLLALLLPCALVCACEKRAAPPMAPEPSPTSAAGEADSPMGLTGVLDEDAFKALHELTGEQAPTPRGEMIELAGAQAYLTLPEGATGPVPAVIVIHEWWGLNQHIKYWADRLAADGYAALAVDLYGGQVATTPDEAMSLMKSVDGARAKAILTAAHTFLGEDARVQAKKRGVIGWCFGGGWSLQTALTVPELDAAVIYYGRLIDDPAQLGAIEAPMMGVFGNQDEGIPPASVDAFEAAMKEAGKSIEVHRFDANHAFANPSSARYDHDAAARAWEATRAFLAAHLKEQ